MNETKDKFLIKHSCVIAISNSLTLLERKLYNFLLGHAYIFLQDTEIHTIKLGDLKNRIGFDSNNIEYLKDSLKKLISVVVEFNLLGKERNDNWSASTLLSSVEFKKGECYYSFSPVMREKLHNANMYSKLNLALVKVFSSKYSLCLYEIVNDYIAIRQTPFIKLDTFKKLMGVPQGSYYEFKRLNQRVITPSIKELNTLAGFTIATEYEYEKRKVVAIKFLVHHVKVADKKPLDKIEQKILENQDLQKSLIGDFGLTLRQVNKTLKDYPIPYIKETLQIIKQKRSQNIIDNIPAYTITALKNDYTKPQSGKNQQLPNCLGESTSFKNKKVHQVGLENDQNISKASVLSSDYTISSLQAQKLSSAKSQELQNKAKRYFESLSKIEQEKLIKKFESEKIKSSILKDLYEKEGLESPLFRVMFYGFINKVQVD